MDVRLPDGTLVQGVPDGTTKADLVQRLQRNGMAVPAEWLDSKPAAPASVQAGTTLREIPRQLGLTARYGLEGLGQASEVLTEPIRQLLNPALRAVGLPQAAPTGQAASALADTLGLPAPQTPDERVVADATRLVAGAGGVAGGARVLARGATGLAQAVTQGLASNPGQQAVGAATAGLAGGSVREAGGGPGEQAAAALAGGIAGGAAAAKASQALPAFLDAAKRRLTPQTELVRQADQQINLVLRRQGINWAEVPESIKAGMREEVAQALRTGEQLNPDALRRLLVFQRTGTTPTVGMLTQDPGQITREQNLARTGANSTDPSLQRLPSLANRNTATLLQSLDDAGAANAPGAYEAGRRVIGSLDAQAARAKSEIDALYGAARDTAGRSADLDPYAFTKRANELLDEALLGSKLPPDVANVMNWIATGKKPVGMHGSVPMPFNVDIAEQLKTRIGDLQRSAQDGQVRKALGIVRQALDETPLRAAPQVNPGNLPAVPGTVPPSPAALGQESIDAFNKARAANRAWMQRVEANPALRAAVDGVEPDQFVQRFIIGKGATAADMRALRGELDPQAMQAVKQRLVRYLRDAATGSTDDITKFSNAAYRRALRDIGEEKLSVFFAPEELQRLRDVGDAAKYMQAQPAGSAVNNSNSGALMLGRGLDMLGRVAQKAPLGLRDVITGAVQGAQQTQVLRPSNALALRQQPQQLVPLSSLLQPAAPGIALSAFPGIPQRQDRDRP